MQHLFRRITLPVLAAGVLALPALGAAYADGGAAPGDTPPVGLLCNGQAPTMWATADNQTITGTDGNDVIAANGFHGLTLKGGAGNDTICGANDPAGTATNTTLDGGAGDDILISTGGRDRLIGGAGNDRLTGTIHNDVVYSSDGYQAGAAGITVNLPAGTVTGANTGTDTLVGLSEARIFGTDGADTFVGDDNPNWFDGGAGADHIRGGGGDDWFHAVDPALIQGNGGNDTVTIGFGGMVKGGKGDDTIAADPNNTISGASADSGTAVTGYKLNGGSGDDTFLVATLKSGATWNTDPALHWKGSIAGGGGLNTISYHWLGSEANLHSSTVNGAATWSLGHLTFGGIQKVVGTPGDDYLQGGPDNDTLLGKKGNDTLLGRAGNDKLRGAKGDDVVRGGKGNDNMHGGLGNDQGFGGRGTDTCKSIETTKGCES